MIILEGADNTGKSSLAKILEKELGMDIRHSVKPSGTKEDCYWSAMEQINSQMIIADRVTVISEMVYGPIIRGETSLGELHQQVMYDFLNKDFLVINCRPPLENILDNKGREQMEGVLTHHTEIVNGYDRVMVDLRRFGVGEVIDYDWTNSLSLGRVLSECKKHQEKHRERILSSIFLHRGTTHE